MSTPNNTFVSAEAYHDAISTRARQIWREQGRPMGQDVQIWLRAERELAHDGLIPPSPPPKLRNRVRGKAASDEINQDELGRRLSGFGSTTARSATSIDPTVP